MHFLDKKQKRNQISLTSTPVISRDTGLMKISVIEDL